MRNSLALFAFFALCTACVGRSFEERSSAKAPPPPAQQQAKAPPKPTNAQRAFPPASSSNNSDGSDGGDGLGPGSAEGGAVSTNFPAAMVSFTFDDGWANQDLAGAEIRAKGWHATYFIVPSWIGAPGFLTFDAVQSLAAQHEIGAHTMTHPQLEHIAPDLVAYEMGASQAWLTNFLGGVSVSSFASPFGDYDDTVVQVAKGVFQAHRGLGCTVALANQDPYTLPGCPLAGTGGVGGEQVQQLNALIEQAKQQSGWAIFVFHHVKLDAAGNASDFQALVDAVAAAHVRVVTLAEGAAMLHRQRAGAPLDVTDPMFGDHAPW